MGADKKILGLDDDDSVVEMRKRHLSLGLRMQSLACAALEQLEAKAKAGEPLNLSVEDAKSLLDSGRRLEQAALGATELDDDTPSPKKPVN